jgi:glycosyltransferase involved in cell wall biosynthesis
MTRTVLVCEAQVPFVKGGAEYFSSELVRQLCEHGYETELVRVPFKWYPKPELFAQAAAWRLLDVSESSGRPIDLVITTKFPTYCVRHPNKVAWLLHQYRAAYELAGTPFSEFEHVEEDVVTRDRLMALDTAMLGECRRLYAISRTSADRVTRYNGLPVGTVYHPPRLAERLHGGEAGRYVLSIGRLESIKRVDLAVRALAHAPADLQLIVAGTGSQRASLEALAESLGVSSRVRFLGAVTDEDAIALYASALAVIFPPYEEDYGYVTLEAFLSHKPVITTTDAGGPNEFVLDGTSGLVCEPEAEALGAAMTRLHTDRARAAAMGDAGFECARAVTWTGVIDQLVGDADRAGAA